MLYVWAAALLHTNDKERMYGPQDTSQRSCETREGLEACSPGVPRTPKKRKRSKRGASRSHTAALNKSVSKAGLSRPSLGSK